LYIIEERYDQAIAILKRGEENIADDARHALYKNLGWAYLGKTDTQKALGYLQTSLALREDVADTHYLLGLVYEELGESELAVAAFERFLELADADMHLEWMDDARLRMEQLSKD
jgi:tetratricopeptide (TPR) repeat protein